MKSNYTSNHPLMKMSPLDMLSTRPQHEKLKPETVAVTIISMEKGSQGNKGFKK